MIGTYIFMALLCVAILPVQSMDRAFFSRENRVLMSVQMRSQSMHEEGIVPNHDLITLNPMSIPNEECPECGPERVAHNFLYSLGCIISLAQYGPSIYAVLCV